MIIATKPELPGPATAPSTHKIRILMKVITALVIGVIAVGGGSVVAPGPAQAHWLTSCTDAFKKIRDFFTQIETIFNPVPDGLMDRHDVNFIIEDSHRLAARGVDTLNQALILEAMHYNTWAHGDINRGLWLNPNGIFNTVFVDFDRADRIRTGSWDGLIDMQDLNAVIDEGLCYSRY